MDRNALAREFTVADLSPVFRTNGNTLPADARYQQHLAENFLNWRLDVARCGRDSRCPCRWTKSSRLPQRTQITRHDCVEGWSAIGQWTGVPLSGHPRPACGRKPVQDSSCSIAPTIFDGTPYYESIDLIDAYHPQTILAHSMNGGKLPVRPRRPAAPARRTAARLQACQIS